MKDGGASPSRYPTVDAAIAHARARGVDRLDAQLLAAHALGRSRAWVIAHGDEPLASGEADTLRAMVTRRVDGEPLAYLVGEKEFHGLSLQVDRRVLVPRPDSETLVEWALALLRDPSSGWPARPSVLDLGTGSGALAASVACGFNAASVVAVDRSEDALAVAKTNFARLCPNVESRVGDWWTAVADRRFDLVVSNPPYVADDDPHLAALAHEPRAALTAGADGLDDIRRIVASASGHLSPGGWLLLEHGHDQAAAVCSLLATHGFVDIDTHADLSGNPRISGGRWPR